MNYRRIGFFLFCLILCGSNVQAQWLSRSYVLDPGWNAIYLPIQPVPAACSNVFSGLPVESVAWWCRQDTGAEYSSDPADPFPRSAHWLKWVPAQPESSTFNGLLAGEAYLVNLKTNVSMEFSLSGRAEVVQANWIHDEYNLVGVPIHESTPVTFVDYFSFSDDIGVFAEDGGDIQEVLSDGTVQPIFRPQLENMVSGEAYWVLCGPRATEFSGPIRVILNGGEKAMDYGDAYAPKTLKILNETDSVRWVTLRHVASENPPSGIGAVPVAGKTPLLLRHTYFEDGYLQEKYLEFPDVFTTNVPPRSVLELRMMPDIFALTNGAPGEAWQSILEVSDEGNELPGSVVVQHVGVKADVPAAGTFDSTGLWVGEVVVDHVSRAPSRPGGTNTWDTVTPVPVSRPYTFRVLFHVDGSGNSRLLQQVFPSLLAQTNGVSETMLFTDASYASQYKTDHPDAEMVRISSSNFNPMAPFLMTGSFGSSNLSGVIPLAFDDPVNPFVHPYHPQHDNKEYRNGVPSAWGAGVESFDVSRSIRFDFANEDPLGSANPQWNISERGGVFEETVTGLNKEIYVRGVFRLQKISDCSILSYLN